MTAFARPRLALFPKHLSDKFLVLVDVVEVLEEPRSKFQIYAYVPVLIS